MGQPREELRWQRWTTTVLLVIPESIGPTTNCKGWSEFFQKPMIATDGAGEQV